MPLNEFNFYSWYMCINRSGATQSIFKNFQGLERIAFRLPAKVRVTVLSSAEKQGRKDKNPEHCNLPTSYVFGICIPSKTDFYYIL